MPTMRCARACAANAIAHALDDVLRASRDTEQPERQKHVTAQVRHDSYGSTIQRSHGVDLSNSATTPQLVSPTSTITFYSKIVIQRVMERIEDAGAIAGNLVMHVSKGQLADFSQFLLQVSWRLWRRL